MFKSVMLGALGGLAMAIAAPPFSLWPLAWLGLVPLWSVLFRSPRSPSPRSDTPTTPTSTVTTWATTWATAWAWAITYNGMTLRWIWGLHPLTWMGIPEGPSWTIALLCWVFVTLWGSLIPLLWIGLMQAAGHWIPRSLPRLLLGTGLWCLLDELLSLTPLYWNPISLTQSPSNRAILHLGRLGGPLWIVAALVVVNGLVALGLRQMWRKGMPQHWQFPRAGIAALCLFLGLQGVGTGLMLSSPASTPNSKPDLTLGPDLQLGIIQGNVSTRTKLTPQGIDQSIQRYLQGYTTLASQGVAAVLMPEGALPFALEEATGITQQIIERVSDPGWPQRTVAWVGAFGRVGDRYTQSLWGFDPAKLENPTNAPVADPLKAPADAPMKTPVQSVLAQAPRYNKIKLVPLGEYIPLESTVGALLERLSPLPAGMVPGTREQILETPFGRTAVEICYEPAFSHLLRRQVAQGAEFVLSSSNLDPYSEVLMAQSEAHDVMRAIETDRWIVRATTTGYSGFINPQGRVVERLPAQQEAIAQHIIQRRRGQTPYVRWGQWSPLPWIGLMGFGMLLSRGDRQPHSAHHR